MPSRWRTIPFAAPAALILVVALAGAAFGANVLTNAAPQPEEVTDPPVETTIATWEDLDGNGVDDDCQTEEVEADADAEAAANTAVDTDGDGVVSVPEAAHSERTGGLNCNHGGYVSTVAQEGEDDGDEETEEQAAEPEACEAAEAAPVPEFDPAVFNGPGAFGAYVSSIAGSEAVGGPNCNHGGAVSEAVDAAKEAAREAREAEKAAAAAERAAAKAERAAARAAAKAEREAARAERTAGKGKGKGGD